MDKRLLIIGILSLILISGCSDDGDNYEIVGDSVMVNDSNIYMLITPHTIQHSDWVELEFESKIFSGDVDVVFGFDTDGVIPTKVQYYNPHEEDTTHTYTCDYDFTYNATHFWCFNEQQNGTTQIFEHDYDGGNITTQTAWWNTTDIVNWTDLSGSFNSVQFDFDGKDTWYYMSGQNINVGQDYKIRYYLEVDYLANPTTYKYDVALKPSSETIEQAIQNNHFYFIDPWADTPSLNTNLVAYYSFDDGVGGAGTNLSDLSGGNRNLTEIGTPARSVGKLNASWFYGDSDDDKLNMSPKMDLLFNDDAISIAFWFNASAGIGGNEYLAGMDSPHFTVQCIGAVNYFEVAMSGNRLNATNVSEGIYTTPCNTADAGWTFIATTYDATHLKLWIGNSTDLLNFSKVGSGVLGAVTSEFVIGDHLDFNDVSGIHGSIDEFGLWNKTLSDGEISALWNSGVGLSYATTTTSSMSIDNLQIAPSLAYATTGDLNGSAFIYNDNGNNYNVTINWTNSTNFLTQDIQNAKANGTHSSFNLTGHSFTVGEVINLTMFAVEQNNESINLTSSITITILDTTPTWSVHPNNQTINHTTNISLQYTCTDPDGAPYYDILNFTGNLLTPLTINSTGYIGYDPNVTETGTYDYNVTCGQNNENISQVLNITILNNIPTIPNNLSPDDNWSIFGTAVNLTCANGTDIDEDLLYYEFWGNISTNNFDLLQNTTSATYNWTGLTSGLDYNWNCRAYDTYNYSGFTTNRTIIPINFTDCVGDQNVALNFTYQNEDNGTALTETFKSNLQLENQDGDTSEVLFDLSTNTNHRICLDNDNQSITINTGMIEYVADSHDARNYYFWNATIQQNVTNNIILYSLQTDLASGISITVEDDSGVGLEERIVYVERYNVETNTYKLIAMGRTGDDGQDVIFLRGGTTSTGDAWYRFKVYYEGELLLTTLPQKIIQSTVTLRIGLEDYLEHVENIEDVGHTLTYNETTRAITATFSTASGLPRNVCLQVVEERPGAYIYNKYDECLNTASGVLTYTHDDTDFTYHAYVYSSASAKELLEVLNIQNITDNFGTTGVFISALLVIILITIGTFSPVAAVIFGTLGIIGANAIGILTVGQSTIISIVALALIIIIRIGRGGR